MTSLEVTLQLFFGCDRLAAKVPKARKSHCQNPNQRIRKKQNAHEITESFSERRHLLTLPIPSKIPTSRCHQTDMSCQLAIHTDASCWCSNGRNRSRVMIKFSYEGPVRGSCVLMLTTVTPWVCSRGGDWLGLFSRYIVTKKNKIKIKIKKERKKRTTRHSSGSFLLARPAHENNKFSTGGFWSHHQKTVPIQSLVAKWILEDFEKNHQKKLPEKKIP